MSRIQIQVRVDALAADRIQHLTAEYGIARGELLRMYFAAAEREDRSVEQLLREWARTRRKPDPIDPWGKP